MIRNWGAVLSLLGLIALVITGVLFFDRPYEDTNQTAAVKKYTHGSINYDLSAVFIAVTDWVKGNRETIDALSAIGSVLFAAALAVFTLVLALKTSGLFKETEAIGKGADAQKADTLRAIKATETLAETARRTVQSTERAERARMFFRATETGLTVDMGAVVNPSTVGDGCLTCDLLNMVRTPAILMEHFNQVIIQPRSGRPAPECGPDTIILGKPAAFRTVFPSGFIVSAGGTYIFRENTLRMPLDFGDEWYSFAENTGIRSDMYLIGYIKYEDVFGAVHIRGYCAIFDIFNNRFVLIGGERQNYEKTIRVGGAYPG